MPLHPVVVKMLEAVRLSGRPQLSEGTPAMARAVIAAGVAVFGKGPGVGDATLYPLADSWYTGANIPGKPRVFMPYVGGMDKYKAFCDRETQTRYQSFVLS